MRPFSVRSNGPQRRLLHFQSCSPRAALLSAPLPKGFLRLTSPFACDPKDECAVQEYEKLRSGVTVRNVGAAKDQLEGNYVVILNVRRLETDATFRWKILQKPHGGSWIIAEKEETKLD
jgi:hypothetical protein